MQIIIVRKIGHQMIQCSGKHTILFSESDNHGRGDIKVTWADMKRNEINQTTHEIVTYALRLFAVANDWLKPFEVQGFTSAYLSVDDDDNHALFYANPCMEETDITLQW